MISFLFPVSLQDIQLRKAFRSSQLFDQQVVSRETMPKAMLECYLACDKPPPLDKLNPYRYQHQQQHHALIDLSKATANTNLSSMSR